MSELEHNQECEVELMGGGGDAAYQVSLWFLLSVLS